MNKAGSFNPEENFRIGRWLVKPRDGSLEAGDERVRLEPKAMAVLVTLAGEARKTVSRNQLFDAVWPNQEISDDTLTGVVSTLRRALGNDVQGESLIETIPKRGYRLTQPIRRESVLPGLSEEGGRSQQMARPSSGIRKSLLVAAVGAVLATFILFLFTWKDSVTAIEDRSIAVLPFDVFSDDTQMEHFASGLEEELIHQLAGNPGLLVIARTSSARFGDKTRTISEISEILNVRHVIEGSVRDGPHGIRITVQLIDAETDAHLWSRVFDGDDENLSFVQEQVGLEVSQLMTGSQTPGPASGALATGQAISSRHPVPESAYRLFLLGEAHMRVGSADAYRTAAGYFSDAVQIAPRYALAYSRLAAAEMLRFQYDNQPLEQASSLASKALEKALNIEPDQPEALATMGLMLTYLKEYRQAESYFRRAIDVQPNLRFALHNFGFMLYREARYEEALPFLQRALTIDPLSGVTNFLVGDVLVGTGNLEAAEQHYLHCMEVLPDYYSCPAGLAVLQRLMGEYEHSFESLQYAAGLIEEGNFWHLLSEGQLAIHVGDYQTAESTLNAASQVFPQQYNLLRTRLLLSLGTNRLTDFVDEMEAMSSSFPDDRDVSLVSALAQFHAGNCSAVLAHYDPQITGSESFLVDIWDLESGFSHAVALAYCYGVSGRHSEKEAMVHLLEKKVDEISTTPVLSQDYLRASLAVLQGNSDVASDVLGGLTADGWTLIWLADKQPQFN